MKREVYFNLHKGGFSVRNPATRLVENKNVMTTNVTLRDVSFRVSERGRERVLREKRKNVHAVAVGEVAADADTAGATVPVSYNPYRGPTFFRKDTGEPVVSAKLLVMIVRDGKPVCLAEL